MEYTEEFLLEMEQLREQIEEENRYMQALYEHMEQIKLESCEKGGE